MSTGAVQLYNWSESSVIAVKKLVGRNQLESS